MNKIEKHKEQACKNYWKCQACHNTIPLISFDYEISGTMCEDCMTTYYLTINFITFILTIFIGGLFFL